MGNNEVVGPFGAGTVLGWRAPPLWMVRATLALKATRVRQLLDAGIERATGGSGGVRSWEGMKMFLNAQTRPDDPSRKRTNESFRKNLEELLRTAQKAEAKVVLSTVACNLKDCAPFASVHSRKLTEAQLAAWEQLYRQGMASEEAGSWRQAVEKYAGAAALDGEFAELQFRLGRCYLALTNEDQARRCLELARDFDALAFRTDSRLNAIIREAGEKFRGKGLRLMEAEEALGPESRIQSPQSAVHGPRLVPGEEVFYEHVHLNFDGNYRLAKPLSSVEVPPTVQAVVAARIDALPGPEKRLLQQADIEESLDEPRFVPDEIQTGDRLVNFQDLVVHAHQVRVAPAMRPAQRPGQCARRTVAERDGAALREAQEDVVMHGPIVSLLLPEQLHRHGGVLLLEERQTARRRLRPDAFPAQGHQPLQRVERRLLQGPRHPGPPPIKRSHTASLMGRPVSFSIQRYWPLGLISRNT